MQLDSNDSTAPGSWHLDKLFIKKCESLSDPAGRMWLVDVNAWLCTPNLDRQPWWSRTSLHRQPKEALGAPDLMQISVMPGQPVHAYRIDIQTGSQWDGGFGGHIVLGIAGENFSTNLHMSWKKSATHRVPFRRKQHDVFLFDGRKNHNLPFIGRLRSLTLSLIEPKNCRWFVARVAVACVPAHVRTHVQTHVQMH